MESARNWHIMGNIAARFFDDVRHVDQDKRVNDLFKDRTCARVLKSVDKSNDFINILCIAFAALAISLGMAALSNAIFSSYEEPAPPSPDPIPSPSAPPLETKENTPGDNSIPKGKAEKKEK